MSKMTNPSVSEPSRPDRPQFHWPSFLIAVLAAVSLLTIIGASMGLLFLGLFNLFTPDSSQYETASTFSYLVAGALLAGLLLPAAVFAIQRLSGRLPITSRLLDGRLEKIPLWGLLLLYALTVGAGTALLHFEVLVWLAVPLLNMISLALPVLIFVKVGGHKLRRGSVQWTWSMFAVSMTLTLVITILVEIAVMILGIVLLALVGDAFFPVQLEQIIHTISGARLAGPDEAEQIIVDLFQNRMFVAILFSFLAIIVPVIEELLKPTAIWLTARRPMTVQEGWFAGLLAGAGFALVENLGNVVISSDWAFLVLARFGATALHMFNTGLIGYTYALARKQKLYIRLVPAFLMVMMIHGIWNGTVIFANVGAQDGLETIWPVGFMVALVLLAVALGVGIVLMNRKLQQENADLSNIESIESEIVNNGSDSPTG